jgi:hypothetical protein
MRVEPRPIHEQNSNNTRDHQTKMPEHRSRHNGRTHHEHYTERVPFSHACLPGVSARLERGANILRFLFILPPYAGIYNPACLFFCFLAFGGLFSVYYFFPVQEA